jgi:hypothetical protein
VFEGGEEAIHHGIVPAVALGGQAAVDLAVHQQLPLGRGPLLTSMIGVDQELIRFDSAVPQGSVEGLKHQGGLHDGAQGPAHNTSSVQIDLNG